MNVDVNTITTLVALLGAVGTILFAVRKVAAAELAITTSSTTLTDHAKRVRVLEDELLILKSDHKNHAANDDRIMGEINDRLGNLTTAFEDMRQDIADIGAAVRATRGRSGRDPKET